MSSAWEQSASPPNSNYGGGSNQDQIAKQITNLNTLIGQMRELVVSLERGTSTRQERDRLRDIRNDLRNLITTIKGDLQRDTGDRGRHEKMVNQFRSALEPFEALSKRSLKAESSLLDEVQRTKSTAFGKNNRVSVALQNQREDTLAAYGLKSVEEVDSRIIQETNQDIQNVQRDLAAVQDVMKDFNNLMVEDGYRLNDVEANTSSAVVHVEDARHELGVAEKLKNAIRKKKVIIAAIIICILIVIGVILAVYFGR